MNMMMERPAPEIILKTILDVVVLVNFCVIKLLINTPISTDNPEIKPSKFNSLTSLIL